MNKDRKTNQRTGNITNKKPVKKKKKNHKKLRAFFMFLFVIIFIAIVIVSGIVVANFKVAMDEFDTNDLVIGESNSTILDSEGNVIATLNGDEKRKIISVNEMADYLPVAYIAIEDERFRQHKGVDFKRTAAAIFNFVTRAGSTSFGGSTITQQLVKNATSDNEKTVDRKIKEWARAYKVENVFSKDQILETYLNIIFVGQDYYGVELGAQYYFNKSAKDLSLAQCAFLAGINHSPNAYKPFAEDPEGTRMEKIKKRTKTVLGKMNELGYIKTQEEYNNAIAEVDNGLAFSKGGAQGNVYSYHTDALISELIEDIAEQKGLSKPLATSYLYGGGLTIYSTQVGNVQTAIEEEVKNKKYVLESKKNPGTNAEAALVVIDHTNGHVVGCAGGLGDKNSSRGLNRATQTVRQTGSAFKPVAVVGPALQERMITANSIYDDVYTVFPGNYKPKNYNGFKGRITVRQAVETSQNIPFVKIMQELGIEKSKEYLAKMGITSLTDRDCGLSLAIGGLDKGVSPLEMAAAYATIANDGEYIEPIFYTKVEDSQKNIVLQVSQEKHKVFDKDVNYILQNILQEPVRGGAGTAKYCAIGNVDTAAKTGTTNDDYDRWLCGFTTYYTATAWYGYDENEEVNYRGTNPAGLLWSGVMKKIHQNVQAKYFTRPSGIISATICKETGLCASETCADVVTDIFVSGSIPAVCEGHVVEETPIEEVQPEDIGVNITEIPITNIIEDTTTDKKTETPKTTNTSKKENTSKPENTNKQENTVKKEEQKPVDNTANTDKVENTNKTENKNKTENTTNVVENTNTTKPTENEKKENESVSTSTNSKPDTTPAQKTEPEKETEASDTSKQPESLQEGEDKGTQTSN